MKKIRHPRADRLPLRASLVATLAAFTLAGCGGGDGSSPGTSAPGGGGPTNPLPAQITGKAIDGYLAGATVCLDSNSNNACDAGESSTTTDANGNYALPYSDEALGKKLLALVTPSTKDLSRPTGFQFPASFTLSQIVGGKDAQQITPLTTMVVALLEAGLSQAEATTAVQSLLGSEIDPSIDYVANGDTETTALAAQIVDKLGSYATDGRVDADTVRNVLNAIIAKGDIASVTQSDLTAQASKPVYTVADASQVLAKPTHSFLGYMVSVYGGAGTPANEALVREVRQIADGALQTTQQENQPHGTNTWIDVPLEDFDSGKYDGLLGQYALKADGTWSGFLSETKMQAALPLTKVGTTLEGTDPNTGIGFDVQYRQVDLDNHPLSIATPSYVDPGDHSFIDFAKLPEFTSTTFSSGTKAYLGMQSYSSDRVVLPVPVPFCTSATISADYTSFDCLDTNPPMKMPYVLGNPNTVYTSIQQAIGLQLSDNMTIGNVQLSANGQAQVEGVSATWSTYSRNPNILVIDVPSANIAQVASGSGWWDRLRVGAKLVVALHEGHLRFGWLYPKSYTAKSIEFSSALPSELVDALHAASAERFPQ